MGRVAISDTVCFKHYDEIALSCMVKETEAIWCFALFVTNLKIDNDPHFWGKLGRVVCLHTQRNSRHFLSVKYSLKLGKASLHRYYVGEKVCQIIYLSGTVFEIQEFLCFAIFAKIQNGTILVGRIFFENWVSYSA